MKIGAHVSIAGGVSNAPINAKEEGLETLQMFSRSPRSFSAPPLDPEQVQLFKQYMKEYGIENAYIHAPYLVNLAAEKNTTRHGSIRILKDELARGTELGVRAVMFHTGSAASQPDRETAIQVAIKSLNEVMKDYDGTTMLLVENAAGAGAVLGCTFEEVATIMNGIEHNTDKVGFCLDTQHAFASGYDMRTKKDVDHLVEEIDKHIGLDRLIVVQLNDSKTEFDSRKDRHEHIATGNIGEEGIGYLINHPKLKHLDFALETPFEGREEDIETVKRLRK